MNQGLTETVKTIEGLVGILDELLFDMESWQICHSLLLSLKVNYVMYKFL